MAANALGAAACVEQLGQVIGAGLTYDWRTDHDAGEETPPDRRAGTSPSPAQRRATRRHRARCARAQ
jgi:hypothetical protein